MPLTQQERHNLIMKAGEVAGLSVALVGHLSADVPQMSLVTAAAVLENKVVELKALIVQDITD